MNGNKIGKWLYIREVAERKKSEILGLNATWFLDSEWLVNAILPLISKDPFKLLFLMKDIIQNLI